jgi:hypothetical protein
LTHGKGARIAAEHGLDDPFGQPQEHRDLRKDHPSNVEFGAASPACSGENHPIRRKKQPVFMVGRRLSTADLPRNSKVNGSPLRLDIHLLIMAAFAVLGEELGGAGQQTFLLVAVS